MLTGADGGVDLARIRTISVDLTVEVGRASMTVADLMALESGALIALDRSSADPVDLLANGRLIARGELVSSGDRFGLRITELVDAP